jgi:hypothetical protein
MMEWRGLRLGRIKITGASMSEQNQTEMVEPVWLVKLKRTGLYVVAMLIGGLVVGIGNFADLIGKSYDRFKPSEALVLAENTAKSKFSDELARRAWRRLFWADNFCARVITHAPISDIEASWGAYIDSDADWNANIMISIVGLEHYYDASRSEELEEKIHTVSG